MQILPIKFHPGIILFLVLIITCSVYWPGLNGPLLLDDIPNLFHLHRFGDDIISWKQVFELTPHGISRPISTLSFLGNWVTTGENVWVLKFTNLMIHLLCGILIYCLSWLLLNYDILKNEKYAQYTALWIAILWLLSPFLLSSVLYVIQRMTQLSALFTLCGLILYVIGRKKYEKKESYGISLIVISIVCFWPLATLSKQNGILLPLLILIIEFFFFYKDSVLDRVKKLRLVLAIPVFIPLLIIFVVILVNSAWLLDGYSGRNFTLYERLISQPRILIDYIGNLLLFPGVSPMGLFHDDYIKSTNLFTPVTTIPSIVFLILILTAAFLTIGKQTGIISFGFVFFYVAHIVESTFIPLELYFEHRNYLPSIGIYFSIVTGIALLLQNIKYRPFVIALLLIAPLTFSILTYQRSLIWQKKTSIYFLSEIHHPDSPRVNEGLAFIHLLNNDANSALKHLDKVSALEQRQRAPEFYFKYLLAYCYGNKNMPDDMYKNKIKIKSLSNELSTVIYLNKFIESVVNGRCNSLNLNYIAEDFSIAITNRDKRYDRDEKSYVNLLLAELLDYLGRDREAEIQRLNAVIHSK